MAAPDLRSLVHFGYDILTTTVDPTTGKILAQLGDVHKETTDTDNAEMVQQVGIASRPSNPEAGKQAAQAVCIKTGDHDVCVGTQDLRGLGLYGNIKPGETCVYAAGADGTAQGRIMLKGDGSITIFTTSDNTEDGNALYFRVSPTGLEFVSEFGTLKFDSTGFHINHASGARFDLGGISGMPSPLDQLSSYVRMQASSLISNITCASFGADAGHVPLASATAIKAILAQQAVQIAAIQTALAGLSAVPFGFMAAPATAAAATAIGAATAAITATETTVLDTNTSST
jgi:hypothetical protein